LTIRGEVVFFEVKRKIPEEVEEINDRKKI